ncbi:type II toxin-antitoxin system VapC family toxin [Cellulomonas sp. PS-H5]|uniref:type II toxin-antitoxin system VapC family toxin n=1 Tax=Cellulomonas sp. PS-H5 TaxID=2820400 RepID=UPI001C4E608C|nr:type II toxin-antitoxin system VapC family toxin [Cellulomonas sp. PS-H5]MBW0253585.1 type II toxin-antitoxin system VapC family toxin [Cellulomonas sp. PS-H5]
MIVLDTNVLSEPLRAQPDEHVLAWLEELEEPVAITAVSVGELLVGAERLPKGRRRDELLLAVEAVAAAFEDDVLPYDAAAARRFATMHVARRAAGHPLSTEDGMIAAICAGHGARLATRNTRDFVGLGLVLVDPWAAERP